MIMIIGEIGLTDAVLVTFSHFPKDRRAQLNSADLHFYQFASFIEKDGNIGWLL